jgi:hypothetical protein
MPARYIVQILDDLDWPGAETPADVTAQLTLTTDDGSGPVTRKATLYLTREHHARLAADLDPWFAIQEKGAEQARGGHDVAGRKQYRARQREFVDLFGIRCRKNPAYPAYMTSTGQNGYFPEWLDTAFEDWIDAGCPPPEQYKKEVA